MTADSGDEADISVSSSYPLSYSRASPKTVIVRKNLLEGIRLRIWEIEESLRESSIYRKNNKKGSE